MRVIKCDQCGKVDKPEMKVLTLELKAIGSNHDISAFKSGDFCSKECVTNFIAANLTDLWYKAR